MAMESLEHVIKTVTFLLGGVAEVMAALIIAHATLRALWQYVYSSFHTRVINPLAIRLQLGKALALALEFLLAADIIQTAVAPTWNDIGQLAAIAALRTLLNYFLEKELKHENEMSPQT